MTACLGNRGNFSIQEFYLAHEPAKTAKEAKYFDDQFEIVLGNRSNVSIQEFSINQMHASLLDSPPILGS
jgi:hypothetical protein